MIDVADIAQRAVASAIAKHEATEHIDTIPGVILTVDYSIGRCSVYLKGDPAPTAGVPFNPDLWLVAGDQVSVLVAGSRALTVLSKSRAAGSPAPSSGPIGFRISTTTLAAAAASVTFSPVPTNFKHLMMIGAIRGDVAIGLTTLGVRFNGDAGNNYYTERMSASAAAVQTTEQLAQNAMLMGWYAGGTSTAGLFSSQVMYFPYYGSANRKSCTGTGEAAWGKLTTNVQIWQSGGFWDNVAPITSVTLTNFGGGNFAVGSIFSLYGLA